MRLPLLIVLIWAVIPLKAVFGAEIVRKYTFTDNEAILAVIGEAENQGYEGMKAVSCGIRNRGTLKGVYGLKAPRVKKRLYSEDTEAKAIVAWETSAEPENCAYMLGSTHWENVKAFGEPYWAKSLKKTVLINDHQFYK